MVKQIGSLEVKSKYQVTISSALRKKLKVRVGDVLSVFDDDDFADVVVLKKLSDDDIAKIMKKGK